MWACRCDCGQQTVVSSDNLKSGHTQSCGCSWHEKRLPRKNLVGKRFGMLRVLTFAGRREGRGDSYWKCACDCGNESEASGYNLACGATRSCGCQIRIGLLKANTKHGKTGTIEYRLWAGVLTRCYNTKEQSYQHYGGRGITVCARWRGAGGFENFLSDMGPRPAKGLEIERRNNELGYAPDNCYWATKETQANNKRSTNWVVWEGKRMSLTLACRAAGLKYSTIYHRMRRKGCSFEQAAGLPFRKR